MLNQLSLKDISFPILLVSILPFSIILGPTVSLVNIVFIGLFYCFQFLKTKKLLFMISKQ